MKNIKKPWGFELIWAEAENYVGKKIFIFKGHKLSRQYHKIKEESIYVIAGDLTLEIGQDPIETFELSTGDSHHIPPGTIHRMIAKEDVFIVEVSTPELDDVTRLEDDYGRVEE